MKLVKVIAKKDLYYSDGNKEKFCSKGKEYPVVEKIPQEFFIPGFKIIDDLESTHYFEYETEDFELIFAEQEDLL